MRAKVSPSQPGAPRFARTGAAGIPAVLSPEGAGCVGLSAPTADTRGEPDDAVWARPAGADAHPPTKTSDAKAATNP